MDFDRSVFAPAFIASGMWIPIRVTSTGSPPIITDGHARYSRPDVVKGSLSAEHEIGYQADAFPGLAEGHRVDFLDADGNAIAGKTFRVRQKPYVTENPSDDQTGYFMCANLTTQL